MRHLIETTDWSFSEVKETLALAGALKKGETPPFSFSQKSLGLLFFNPSLRTRVSFIRAIEELGGSALPLDVGKDTWKMVYEPGVVMNQDGAEHVKEAIPVLGRYCDYLGIRAFGEMKNFLEDSQDQMIQSCAEYSSVPIINLESTMAHPCQALADVLTIQELNLPKPKILLTWTYHPKSVPMAVTNSFLLLASRMGWDLTLLHPPDYELAPRTLQTIEKFTQESKGSFQVTKDREKAFDGASVVYSKSWGSGLLYGQPQKELERKESLKDWRVDSQWMKKTRSAVYMHCLPVRRNVEVMDEVLDSQQSKVIDQAENRLHVQKAILCQLARWNKKPQK